jgi:Glycosyl transferase family 2
LTNENERRAMGVHFEILTRPERESSSVVLFSIVNNESYFLPHFLAHYRAIGVKEFWFLDDGSTDSTVEILSCQPDCGVVRSTMSFSDIVEGLRFGIKVRSIFPRTFLKDRWVLTVDADEFLLIPSRYSTIQELVACLEVERLDAVRALMLDFFPRTIDLARQAPLERNPFEICDYFDVFSKVDWPDDRSSPIAISLKDGVRPRLLMELLRRRPDFVKELNGYRHARVNKVPLVKWIDGTDNLSAHRINRPVSSAVQLVLAHFKFVPDMDARIKRALASGNYWNASVEYRFLNLAVNELGSWDLRSDRSTRPFKDARDLESLGLLL